MSLGERLLELRKSKHLSQEEVADKLNVTRQTVSKWETDQTTPDFNKIVPLCELYDITANELLTGEKEVSEYDYSEELKNLEKEDYILTHRAKGIGIAIFLYCIAVVFLIVSIPVFKLNPIIATGVFLIICAIATVFIVYTCIVYKKKKEEKEEDKLLKQVENILSAVTLVIYFLVSFKTMAWHITWIIWIVYGLIYEIIKLIFMLRGDKNEE